MPQTATAPQTIQHLLGTWKPFADLPKEHPVRVRVERFLGMSREEDRRYLMQRASVLFRLQESYADLGILLTGDGENHNPFQALLEMDRGKMTAMLRDGKRQELLTLLQRVFEFGRITVPPNTQAARLFLQEMWALSPGGHNMKFCVFPGGVPFSGNGKTHEETARLWISEGYGSGAPLAGAVLDRAAPLEFEFGLSTNAFRGGMTPPEIKASMLRWIRLTGGDPAKVKLTHVTRPAIEDSTL